MRRRLRFLIGTLAAMVLARDGPSAARAAGDQTHTLIAVNHTDACLHVRVFRDEAGAPTTPPTKPHDLAPRERFSVSIAEAPATVWVEADVMSDRDCSNTEVAAYMAGYAKWGRRRHRGEETEIRVHCSADKGHTAGLALAMHRTDTGPDAEI
jgi:hypothetical protein